MIGASVPAGGIFVGRRFTGEVLTPDYRTLHPDKDWVLTRILWLGGLEPGRNRFGLVDTFSRYIYLHGCPDDCAMGVPLSHGCIRMRSRDILDLFGRVRAGTPVVIHE
jgi:lipoprotein-anchoring transpeptidase ErfK/SrfK